MSATAGFSQSSQFIFDPHGNLVAQMAETGAPPQIIAQPEAQPLVVGPGELSSFFVVLADTSGASYQWRFNGANISGATADALVVTNTSAASEGQYSVVVANSFGSVSSAPALLWFDGNGNGLPDSWEMAYFGNLTNTATGDFDQDGASNLQEFLDGTNPTNAASVFYGLMVLADGGLVEATPTGPRYTKGQVVTLTATPIGAGSFHAWTGDVVSRSNVITVTMTTNRYLFAHFTAIDLNWTNTAGGDWNISSNWNPNLVPVFDDNASIQGNVTVSINQPADCAVLTLGGVGSPPTLTGSSTLTLHGPSTWLAGEMSGSGRTVIAPGGALSIANPNLIFLTGWTLENAGAVTWTGTGNLAMAGAAITNDAGALFDCQNATALELGSGTTAACRFDNVGTLRKSTAGGTTTFGPLVRLNNYGAIEVQKGTLLCSSGFLNDGSVTLFPGTTNRLNGGGSATGSFSNAPTSLVEWTYGDFTLNPGAQLDGDGLYQVNGSTVTLSATTNLTMANLNLLAGTISVTGTLRVNAAMNWTAGTLSGAGRTVITPGAALSMGSQNSHLLTTCTLENDGTATWMGTGTMQLAGAVITNAAGALFVCQKAATLELQGGTTAASRFDNAGTFRTPVEGGTTTFGPLVRLNNYGAIEIQKDTLLCGGAFLNDGSVTLFPGTTNRLARGGSTTGSFSNAPTSLVEWTYGNFTLNPGAQLDGDGLYQVNGSTATLSATTNLTVANLNLLAGTLSVTGTLTIDRAMNWTAGTMSGAGRTVIVPGAALSMGGQNSHQLATRTLENDGTATWTGTGAILLDGAVITNAPGALFDCQKAATLSYSLAASRFDNAGTFRTPVAGGTTTVGPNVRLNNYGVVQIQKGTLLCSGAFLNDGSVTLFPGATNRLARGGSATGSFSNALTSLVEWTYGNFTLNPGAQLDGDGLYQVNGSTATLSATTNLTVANLNLLAGTINGTGTWTVTNAMNWTAGTMSGAGRTVIAPGAALSMGGQNSHQLTTRTLENDSTATWTGTGAILLDGAVITNAPGALFDCQKAATLSYSLAASRFDNAGTFCTSADGGTNRFDFNVRLNNYGAVKIQKGTLLCGGAFLNDGSVTLFPGATNRLARGGSATGSFSNAPTSLVEWTYGNFTLNPGAQLDGDGLYQVNGASATLSATTNLTVANLNLLGGTISVTGTLMVNTAMNWTAGTMSGGGRTVIAPGAALSMNSQNNLSLTTCSLENGGMATWTGGGTCYLNNAVITNRPGALFDCQGHGTLEHSAGTSRFDNAGTFRKSLSTGTTTFSTGLAFHNYDTVQLHSGILAANGGYTSAATSGLECAIGGTTAGTNFGQLRVANTVALDGALGVSLANGYLPTTNDSFTLVTAGTRTGTFSSFAYPSNQVTMQLTNTANAVIADVTAVTALPPPAPLLLLPQLSGSNVVLTWTAVSNATYELDFNPDLTSSNWTAVPGDVTSLSNLASKIDPLTSSNRFYRVRVVP